MRIAAERFHRLQIMQHHGVVAGLRSSTASSSCWRAAENRFDQARVCVVQVPVEGFRERQALRRLQPQRMHVVDEQQQRGELLAARDDAEFGRLLDRVGGVAAGIGKADDLRLWRPAPAAGRTRSPTVLIGCLTPPSTLPPLAVTTADGVALQRMAEGVVGGQEEPAVAAGLGQRLAGAVGQHVGVVGEGDRVRRAGLAGEIGGRGTRVEQHRVLFLDEVVDGQRDAGIRRIGDRVDLLVVDPLPRDVDADVRLVLVIAADHVDLPALLGEAGILDRHLDRDHRIGAADIGIKARHVVQHADLDGLVLGVGRARRGRVPASATARRSAARVFVVHVFPPEVVGRLSCGSRLVLSVAILARTCGLG